MNDWDYSSEEVKVKSKALNEANKAQNSLFALAIIQHTLASKGESAIAVIESVQLLSFFFFTLPPIPPKIIK